MKHIPGRLLWVAVSALGALAWATLALERAEPINSAYILIAALCTYAVGYRFYSQWVALRVLELNDHRATPCQVHDDGKDFVPTNKWIVFGHHFAAIAGPGPLVGPVLAAQFGYLPGTLWILIGAVLAGAVQDFVILFCSLRRDGKSLAQMVKEELHAPAGAIAAIAILSIMTILLAVLALVVVKALAESPWGVFTVGATIPIAVLMGVYLRFWRVGKVLEVSAFGVVLLLLAVWGGQFVHAHPSLAQRFTLGAELLAWAIIVYGLAASVLPVWLLLAPRDYLSTFMKLGTIIVLVMGVLWVLPDLKMPAVTRFVDGSGLVMAGKLFPFCFITIACGAISGFHTLIASGVTPKIITREGYARPIGYGAMCLESLVAIMAMVAACTLEPGVYLCLNVKGAGGDAAAIATDTVGKVTAAGFSVTVEQMNTLARELGEKTLFGRTGGAATLAVGMAQILSTVTHGRWLDLWYHFAIMFEALFILTTLDAGTRVGRYLLHDILGSLWKPLGNTRSMGANFLVSTLVVAGWGYFLVQGVRDPLGGINSLWPLFGIANQLLAAIALCLATTVILKMQLRQKDGAAAPAGPERHGRPVFALITLVPLIWLVSVTFSAGYQKIFADDPRIGFLAQARLLESRQEELEQVIATAAGRTPAVDTAAKEKELHTTVALRFNNLLDAAVAGAFLLLAATILVFSTCEWFLLLARKRVARLFEAEAVWLPEEAVIEGKRLRFLGLLALAAALARELSGEAALDRYLQADNPPTTARQDAERNEKVTAVNARRRPTREQAYLAVTEERFRSFRRCC